MDKKTIEVLVATMKRKAPNFLDKMNLTTDAVVVNQNDSSKGAKEFSFSGGNVHWIDSLDRGLSKSRNLALKHATADICLIADDDMKYHSDYKEKIVKAYEEYPEADIIAFQVKRVGHAERTKKFREKMSWDNYLTSMKISSVEITFRRNKIVENNLSFNTNIGAGTEFYNGEENAFLYAALNAKLRILYLPIEIAEVDMSESSWFEGYTESYFNTVGAKFYNMTNKYYKILIFQFALRKYKLYKDDASLSKSLKQMNQGARKYIEKHGR